ncbi:unnamed protein product [Rhizoctonia solani]|uniref:Chitin-binding type-2 domain-containing protein n=1 Tax=Rhizoctonia solani TaxID=456999 RepID=A0A8H3CTZ4_9AGAM|nr:unnamed protein product [Rhizoctonia solani]
MLGLKFFATLAACTSMVVAAPTTTCTSTVGAPTGGAPTGANNAGPWSTELPQAPPHCKWNEFLFLPKNSCLRLGGTFSLIHPEIGSKCPDGWYMLTEGYCVPRYPNKEPDCDDKKYFFDKDSLTCRLVSESVA